MTTETKKKTKLGSALRERGYFVIALAGSKYQMPGLPDLLVIKDGKHYWIECKNPDTVVDPLQKAVHGQLRKAGCNVFLLRFATEKQWVINDNHIINFSTFNHAVTQLMEKLCSLENLED